MWKILTALFLSTRWNKLGEAVAHASLVFLSALMSTCKILATIYLSHFSGQHVQWASMRYGAQSPSTEDKQASCLLWERWIPSARCSSGVTQAVAYTLEVVLLAVSRAINPFFWSRSCVFCQNPSNSNRHCMWVKSNPRPDKMDRRHVQWFRRYHQILSAQNKCKLDQSQKLSLKGSGSWPNATSW